MATELPGNLIPAPGYYKGNDSIDDELLYSHNRFTQKGCTLKAGQNVLLLGTIMAYETATKTWVKYVNGGSGGAEIPRGILRQSVDTGATADGPGVPRFQGNIVISGIVKQSKVSAANTGAAITQALTDLKARQDTLLGTFTL